MDKIFLLNLENTSKTRFLAILQTELKQKFNGDIDANYSDSSPWGLQTVMANDKIDCYQLIYVNNMCWAGSGGIVRNYNNKKSYQAGFRAFSNASLYNNAIGNKSYSHEYNTKYQISRAIKQNCDEITLSFNLHNERLFRITRDYHLPKVFGKNIWTANEEPVMFNGVQQWLLTMSLK